MALKLHGPCYLQHTVGPVLLDAARTLGDSLVLVMEAKTFGTMKEAAASISTLGDPYPSVLVAW